MMTRLGGARIFRKGDIIKVVLQDTSYNIYFKGKADITNPEQMESLKEKLRAKGVPL